MLSREAAAEARSPKVRDSPDVDRSRIVQRDEIAGNDHGFGNARTLRALRVAARRRGGHRVYLQLRVHVLRDVCQCAERRLPELPRRAGAPATARAQDGRRGFEIRRLTAPSPAETPFRNDGYPTARWPRRRGIETPSRSSARH